MKKIEEHKFARILRMDRECRYNEICEKYKPVPNDLNRQLKRYKSTLNKGKTDLKTTDIKGDE